MFNDFDSTGMGGPGAKTAPEGGTWVVEIVRPFANERVCRIQVDVKDGKLEKPLTAGDVLRQCGVPVWSTTDADLDIVSELSRFI